MPHRCQTSKSGFLNAVSRVYLCDKIVDFFRGTLQYDLGYKTLQTPRYPGGSSVDTVHYPLFGVAKWHRLLL